MTRFFLIVVLFATVGVCIVLKAAIIMFKERGYWNEVADRFVKENVLVDPNRGNILSTDGKLLASSLPEYSLYMDFMVSDPDENRKAKEQAKKDSLFKSHLDEICEGLHRIFPDRSAAAFKQHLQNGRNRKSRYYRIYPRRVSYIQYKEVQKLPFFNLGKNRSGLQGVASNNRKRPFGSLAQRTIGDVYADTALGDRITAENITDIEPIDGADIISTIDVDMQDICEKALVDKLYELNAMVGVAVLMEVKTGEVKAIVNMSKGNDGKYYEMRNNAISDMMEPGSTFKTASIMVALEDGKIEPDTKVDTGNGVKMMHGRPMKDHNWNRGGYGVIDVTRILEVSSNVGVSSIIDQYYYDNPQKFVDGLKRLGITEPLHLQIAGEGKPNIKGPKERYFAKTTLPWMSIGYETQIPPLNILTFYNAIANDGVMVRPKFVKAAVKDGQIIQEYPTEVIREKIASESTLEKIRTILEKVVSQGLAKPAGSKQFAVAGKTGTAQISQGAAGYTAGGRKYLVSFCGYFPADAPKYSLIVSIQKPGLPASGGLMAGSVFSKIAERVFAKNLSYELKNAIDSTTVVIPDVKSGDLAETSYVLGKLNVPTEGKTSKTSWGRVEEDSVGVKLEQQSLKTGIMPNVVGMGAKDAVYLLEKAGLKVNIAGVGKVTRQSIPSGNKYLKGQTVALQLH